MPVVEVHDRIVDQPAWDRVVSESGAPVFYRASILSAYQAAPLQPTLDIRYLAMVHDGRYTAVLPLYHVPSRDPFGIEATGAAQTWAISHFWHCYDTRLPAIEPGAGVTAAMGAAVTRQATAWNACRAVLVNVASGDSLDADLGALGLVNRPRHPRFRLDLGDITTTAGYEAVLPAGVRQELRRHRRLAARAGAEPVLFEPPLTAEVVAGTCALLQKTDHRYNPGYYPAAALAHLLRHGGPAVRVAGLVKDDVLMAASISFVDGPVWHNWAIGVDREATRGFSPYTVLLGATVDMALKHDCDRIELGRTNADWKQRFGARPVQLCSWESPVERGSRS